MDKIKKFKITYWLSGDIRVGYIKAYDITMAKIIFYMEYPCDDIIEVEEEDV